MPLELSTDCVLLYQAKGHQGLAYGGSRELWWAQGQTPHQPGGLWCERAQLSKPGPRFTSVWKTALSPFSLLSVSPSCRAAVVCYQAAPAAGVKLGQKWPSLRPQS